MWVINWAQRTLDCKDLKQKTMSKCDVCLALRAAVKDVRERPGEKTALQEAIRVHRHMFDTARSLYHIRRELFSLLFASIIIGTSVMCWQVGSQTLCRCHGSSQDTSSLFLLWVYQPERTEFMPHHSEDSCVPRPWTWEIFICGGAKSF